MATATRTDKPGGTYLHHWNLTTADADGDAVEFPGAPDRCFQAFGTWGSGTLKFQGSLDGGATWFDLHDPSVTAIGLTDDGGGAILENPLLVRPSLSGSTAADIDVYLLSRSAR